ncbi:MAG: response regulator [Alphaproteobacteria bacterium]|nr:response regulator [Alphaproteobacteria bacterium]MCB9975647.1 response regulator [Rhodospirillales bacterium]
MLHPKDIKVLIVDDHMVVRTMVKNSCAEMGFIDFSYAQDGAEALELIKSGEFDIVLLDWTMPRMSGLDVLKAVRADRAYDGLALVMVTAEAEKERVLEAMEHGITSYIIKPFFQADFEQKMKGVLAWLKEHKKTRTWRGD